jgi:hypothetical protein
MDRSAVSNIHEGALHACMLYKMIPSYNMIATSSKVLIAVLGAYKII